MPDDTLIFGCLADAADLAIASGIQHARADDPHRLASIRRDFDAGKARPRLVMDYLPAGRVRLALEFHGTQGGEPRALEVFATILQGPVTDELLQ